MTLKRIVAVAGGTAQTPALAVEDDDSGGVPGAHAPSHTDGTDQIADATFLLSGLIQGSEKEKLSSLASAIGAAAGDQLIANGGGGSIWTPPVFAMREMFTVSATDPKAEYTNIHDAVAAAVAAGASDTHWFLIMVFPGIYSEVKTTIPQGVVVSAVEPIQSPIVDVRAANVNDVLFVMEGGYLINLYISAVQDALHACVRSSIAGRSSSVIKCRFANCSTAIWAENGSILLVPGVTVVIDGAGQSVDRMLFAEGAGTRVIGNQVATTVPAAILALYPFVEPVRRAVHVENSADVSLAVVSFDISHNTVNQAACEVGAGGHLDLFTAIFTNNHVGVIINAGVGASEAHITGEFDANDLNWDLQSATCQLFFTGSVDDHSKRTLVAGATECSVMQETGTASTETYGPFNLEYPTDRTLELTKFVEERHSSVVGQGGVTITDNGGLSVTVSVATGWIHRPTVYQDAADAAWGPWTHDLTDDATNYIYIDATTLAITHNTVAPAGNCILLFEVLTAAGDIRFMHSVWTNGACRDKLLEDYVRATRRVMLNTGLAATINADPHYWDLGGGSYYYGLLLETITGGAQYPFTYYYGAGGASTLAPAGGNHVDLLQYDNAGVLAAMGAGEYRSDTVFITSDGKASIVLGTTSNALEATAVAEAAATAPLFLYPTVFPIAKLIVQQSVGAGPGVTQVIDLRTTATTTVAPAAADHNTLANLTAPNDAHTQYLLASGARAMGGDLDLGANDILNCTTISGVSPTAHNARHQPGGLDAIALGLPTPIQVGDLQAAGGAASLANSAHVHAVTAAAPVAVGTANAIGAAATSVHSDHVHAGLTRGANDFTVFAVKAAPIPADVVLIEDSAAAGVKKYATVETLKVFGNDYQTALSTARSVTALGAYQTKTTLVTPALTGTYRVGWHAVIDSEIVNRAVHTRLYNATDAAAVGAEQQDRLSTAAGRHPASGFATVVFAGVAKTFQLQWYSPDGGNVGIQDAVIELWRVV